MALLKTKQGIFFSIDDSDIDDVNKYKWFVGKNGYVTNTKGVRTEKINRYLHRYLLRDKLIQNQRIVVDHINQDPLDNRRSNLRIIDRSLNGLNSKKSNGFYLNRGKYICRIMLNRKNYILGKFDSAEEAREKYTSARDFILNGGTICDYLNK